MQVINKMQGINKKGMERGAYINMKFLNTLNKIREQEAEKILYIIGLAFVFLGFLFFGIFWLFDIHFLETISPCVYYTRLGIYCPGCGGTRSFLFLVNGKLLKSFWYHPFVPYFLIITSIFMVTQTIQCLSHGKVKGMKFRAIYLYIGIAILITQWLIKNIALFGWNIHLIP